MRVAARRILAWILVSLLPVNGYAAAVMAVCIAEPAVQAGVSAHGMPQAHEHHAAAPHHQEGGSAGCADERDATNECCMAATVPASSQALAPALPPGPIAIPFLPASEASIFPDGLERPPRPRAA